MASYTSNYGLHQWEPADHFLRSDFNTDFGKIDAALQEINALAAGRADLFVTMRSSPWDHNAARIILEEAGGAVFTVDGDELPLDQKSTVLAFNAMELKDCILCV